MSTLIVCSFLFSLCLSLVHSTAGLVEEWRLDFTPFTSSGVNRNCSGSSVDFLNPPGHYGGYYYIQNTTDGHLFYLFFENRYHDAEAPLVFWTNGGPGCSSFYGLFMENGPYMIQDDLSLCWNPYGWDIGHDIIFIEQPLNVGFSYSSDHEDAVIREEQVAEHMLQFFYSFFHRHPELVHKDFYISGESYAGHYLPAIAERILEANQEKRNIYINLKGVAMGDPWTHPSLQFQSYPLYEYKMGLINEATRDDLLEKWKFCDYDLRYCNTSSPEFSEQLCLEAYIFCDDTLLNPIFQQYPDINYYDIRGDCLVDGCYDVTNLVAFMNSEKVRQQFNISEDLSWIDCSDPVYFDMLWDGGTNLAPTVARLLDRSLEMLIYVGDQDLICNYIGVRAWIDDLDWKMSNEWNQTKDHDWILGDQVVGDIKSVGPLTYIKIIDSGHMVPTDQPAVALQMISEFTQKGKQSKISKRLASQDKSNFLQSSFHERLRPARKLVSDKLA